MKKLTSSQKSVIHGGGAIVGIVQGVSALLTCASMVMELASEHIMDRRRVTRHTAKTNYTPYVEREPKTFSNRIESKIIIFP